MNKFFLILSVCCVFSSYSWAEDVPTFVYGTAQRPDGKQNMFIVEQPKNASNPLGNPIVEPYKPVEVFGDAVSDGQNLQGNSNVSEQQSDIQQNESANQNLGNDFENTLLEANDRVYDIQSYPKADFKAMENPSNPQTIYSPNVND